MDTKNALYAAVGAPIAAAKTLSARFESLRTELESRTEDLTQTAQKMLDEWAKEGRQAVTKISDGKMVDEFASKVDFDQAREQVSKLRDQLEDMLTTWRASFRPVEEAAAKAVDKGDEMTGDAAKTGGSRTTTRPAAKKPAAKKPAAKKPASKSTATKKTAAPKAS